MSFTVWNGFRVGDQNGGIGDEAVEDYDEIRMGSQLIINLHFIGGGREWTFNNFASKCLLLD